MPTKKSKRLSQRLVSSNVDTALQAEVARGLDLELEWFFSYGEAAGARGTLSMLPSHLAKRVRGDDAQAATARVAIELEHQVKTTLNRLPLHHGAVLRAMYSPRSWPHAVRREFKTLTPIAVRLFCATRPWPARTAHQGLETAAARALADALTEKLKPAALKRDAERAFGQAMAAYAESRAAR
jgi:hypothetical protein